MNTDTSNLTFQQLKDRLISCAGELLMLPEVASEALAISNDEECRVEQLTCVVERDVKLATEILKIANSPVFARDKPIVDLKQAIVRLGLRQCRNLILTTSAASLMKSMPLEQEWIREIIWQHSFATATTCVHLNRSLNLGFHGEEFTAGLLHDFGRLLLATAAPNQFAQADDLSFAESTDMLERERAILGTDHCQFGAWFASEQGLPETLVNVIAFHHAPGSDSSRDRLVALVGTADDIANHIQQFEDGACYDPNQNSWIDVLDELYKAPLKDHFVEISETLLAEVVSDCHPSGKLCSANVSEAG